MKAATKKTREEQLMKTTKKLFIAAAALPMIFASASVFAYGGKGGDDMGKRGGKGNDEMRLIRQLDLTDEQKVQLSDMRDAKREERKAGKGENRAERQAEMQAYQTAVQDLVLAKDFDQAQAEELARAMVEKQVERRVSMLESKHEMLSILTDEQKAELKVLQAERMEKMAERMGNRKNRD